MKTTKIYYVNDETDIDTVLVIECLNHRKYIVVKDSETDKVLFKAETPDILQAIESFSKED